MFTTSHPVRNWKRLLTCLPGPDIVKINHADPMPQNLPREIRTIQLDKQNSLYSLPNISITRSPITYLLLPIHVLRCSSNFLPFPNLCFCTFPLQGILLYTFGISHSSLKHSLFCAASLFIFSPCAFDYFF